MTNALYTNVFKYGKVEPFVETGRAYTRLDDAIDNIIDWCDGEYVGTLIVDGYNSKLINCMDEANERHEEAMKAWREDKRHEQSMRVRRMA